ncbi:hypothetical protein O9G_001769 [Rozella allomycis CSF55]|uniref:Replication protein A C-terminal domain-containing protein n=1 Tax=Rozella allomycis (strain CSF55) TaxID=988480 RepID=A0A075AXA6_ROZAC|nr:hypothetical protein O9G_001769 [Rozella allomycis CSF55]|eukprot:EPZ33357.1 hypothetical protein O9G_001769 [Rozella allomycis CSF55]
MASRFSNDAGGFITSTYQDNNSQASPAIKKSSFGTTIRPVTLKMISEAVQAIPNDNNSPFKFETYDLNQVTNLAWSERAAANTTLTMDDGTGQVIVKLLSANFPNVDARLKTFQSNRYVAAFVLLRIETFDELTHHLINAAYAHLQTVKVQAPTSSQLGVNESVPEYSVHTESFDSSMPPHIQRILSVFKRSTAPEGVNVNEVARVTSYGLDDVRASVDWLVNEGQLYSTIDDDHFRYAQ